ncbi:MAG: hypothetical protein HQK51_01975 [Oligoflexia bacterium]|nr:hypothetical protein [Oligoflexia bacterium]
MAQAQQGKKNDIFLYLGDDERYWMAIQGRITGMSKGKTFDFIKEKIYDFENFNLLMLKIIAMSPRVIYLDFTRNPATTLKVGQILKRLDFTKNIIVMGLFEQGIEDIYMYEAYSAGIYINHYKGIELYDVAFDSLVLMYPKESIRCEFACVNRKQDIDIREVMRVGSISKDYLYVEGNAYIENDEFVTLETPIFEKFIFSKNYQIKTKGKENLIYDFDNFYHFSYGYVEPLPPKSDDETAESYRGRENDRNQQIEEIKGRQVDWINNNTGKVSPATKVLIIDKEFTLLNALDHTHKLQSLLSVRVQMCINQEIDAELVRFFPQMIVFYFDRSFSIDAETIEKENLQKEQIEELTKTYETLAKNDETAFGALITAVKKIPSYQPIILVSSTDNKHSSEGLQKCFGYPRIIYSKIGITIEQLTKMDSSYRKLCALEEEKNLKIKLEHLKTSEPKKFRTAKIDQIRNNLVHIGGKDAKSVAFLIHRVTMLTLSESEMILESVKQLKLYTVYSMTTPIDINFTPIMEKKGITSYGYRCLFHSYDEREKTSLRQLLNDLVLESKRRERAQEVENFKKMNQDAKQAKEMRDQEQPGHDQDQDQDQNQNQTKAKTKEKGK